MSKSAFVDMEWASPLMKQIWVVSAVQILVFAQGMSLGFTSALLPALQAKDSEITVDLELSSWIVASLAIACVLSYTICPYLISTCGRRTTMLIELIPAIIGCLLTHFASNVATLIAGRFLNGLTIGSTGVLGAIVVGEYTTPVYRGVFLNLKNAMLFVGCTIVHILGHFLHWRTVALINAVPYALAFVIAYTWPQSPPWLAENKQFEACVKSFYWLRGISEKSSKELKEMIEVQKRRPEDKEKTFYNAIVMFLGKFQKRNFLKPVFVYVFAAILIETSGRHLFPEYALQFVIEITGDANSFYYTLFIDLIITFSAFMSSVLTKKFKRRTLLFTSGIASSLILMLLCSFLFLQAKGFIANIASIPMFLFAAYFVFVNLGCAPICLAIVGEIFPLEHRATATCISGALVSILLVIISKITPFLLSTIKIYGTFSVFGTCMAMSLIVLYYTLPETKDKTLQEIENYFTHGRYTIDSFKNDEEANIMMENGDKELDAVIR